MRPRLGAELLELDFTVVVTPRTLRFGAVGERRQLGVVVRDHQGRVVEAPPLRFGTSNATVATVAEAGEVAATGSGVTSVWVSLQGVTQSVQVLVNTEVAEVRVTPPSLLLTWIGEVHPLRATALGSTGDTLLLPVSWRSTDTTVVVVDDAGRVTARAPGVADIQATADTVDAVPVTVAVQPAVDSVDITPPSATFSSVGDSVVLLATPLDAGGTPVVGIPVAWSTPDTAVVELLPLGTVVARGLGTARVVATAGGVEDTATVSVVPVAARVEIAPPAATLAALQATDTLHATVWDTNGNPIPGAVLTWTSLDPAVVSVDGTGTVRAEAPGVAEVEVRVDGVADTALVTVAPVVASLEVSPSTLALDALGASAPLNATPRDANGHPVAGALVTWSSADPGVAAVDVAGVVTAVAPGSTTVTATSGAVAAAVPVSVAQLPASVEVAPPSDTLRALDATLLLTATVRDANGNAVPGAAVTWSSGDGSVATVAPDGTVTAVANGTALVTAAAGGVTGTAQVTVAQAVALVETMPTSLTLTALGASATATATPRDANGHPVAGAPLAWSSEDPGVATVDASGTVTAVDNGSATVTASSGGVDGTVAVTVAQSVASVEVTPAATTLTALGATASLTVTPRDAYGNPVTGALVTWSSAAPGVATVDVAGTVTATGNGSATLTASSGGADGSSTVTVAQVVTSLELAPATTTLTALGASAAFTATPRDALGSPVAGVAVGWSVDAPAVASVDGAGTVTALANGSATLTADANGILATASVTVAQSVASVTVSPGVDTLTALGETTAFSATARDANGNTVPDASFSWSSDDPGVATVDGSGVATATGNGTATVTASSAGVDGTAQLTVAQTVSSVLLTPTSLSFSALGDTQPLTATALDVNGNPIASPTVAWSSSDPGVVTVDGAGNVTATGNGSATVTATSGAASAGASVTVAQVVDAVTVTPAAATLTALGATQPLLAAVTDANGNLVTGASVSWSSDAPGIVTVDGAGTATAVANGSATATATSGGVSGSAAITVAQAVATITLAPTSLSFAALGGSQSFTPTALDANGNGVAGASFSWSTTDAGVASVDATGNVTAVGNGGATITVTSGAANQTGSVTIAQVVDSVAVAPGAVALSWLGETSALTAQAFDAEGTLVTPSGIAWSTTDAGVATVDGSGTVTAVADGTAGIVATSGGIADTTTVTVAQVATSVSVTPATHTFLSLGATQAFSATPLDAGGTPVAGHTFTWSSDTPGVASVDAGGTVTAVADGSATLTADAGGGLTGTASVTVAQTVATVSVSPASATLTTVAETVGLSASAFDALGNPVPGASVAWSTSNATVAAVDASGTVTGGNDGTATVTATSGSASGNASVTVAVVVDSVEVTPGSVSMTSLADTRNLTAAAFDTDGTLIPAPTFTWSSSDPSVATVSAGGVVTSVDVGTATIRAQAGGVTDSATVTITQPVASVNVTPAVISVAALGLDVNVTVAAYDGSGNLIPDAVFTWSSADPAVATVDSTGVVTSVATGSTTVSVTSEAITTNIPVTVTQNVASIQIAPFPLSLSGAGTMQAVTATALDSNGHVVPGATFTWTSNNTAVFTVDVSGVITTVGNGSTGLRVTSGGRTETFLVTVSGAVP